MTKFEKIIKNRFPIGINENRSIHVNSKKGEKNRNIETTLNVDRTEIRQ